jgi:uncharacterized coiled-coil DUF342 family protein
MFRTIVDFITALLGLGRDVVAEADDYRLAAPALRTEAARALESAQALATKQRAQMAEAKRLRAEIDTFAAEIDAIDAKIDALRSK